MDEKDEVTPPPAMEQQPDSATLDFSQPPAPARVSEQPTNSTMEKLIPAKNSFALFGYYCGVFALVPCFSPILGPTALVLGCLGLKAIKRDPVLPGKAHALVAIVLGSLATVAMLALLVLILIEASQGRNH
jgi:hypothetical protein